MTSKMEVKPMHNVMVDLETMGTAPGSAIVSLGAVAFDPATGQLGEEFYRVIDLKSCQRAGLTIDPDTVTWWLKQSDEARAALTGDEAEALHTALGWFRMWWLQLKARYIWGHGGNFDEPLLSAAFKAAHVALPWDYWNGRCTRTIYDLAGVKPDRAAGTHHNDLDDARAQAVAVCQAYAKLGLAVAEAR